MFSIYQIKDAYKLISENINKTPILFSDKINNLTKSNIIFKAENLQKTGSFKIRGALNFIGQSKIRILLPHQVEIMLKVLQQQQAYTKRIQL